METIKIKASLLPVIDLAGTEFLVDVLQREFRQADAPDNRISMAKIVEEDTEPNSFAFDCRTKNVYEDILRPDCIPDYVTLVIIPPLAEITEKFNRELALADNGSRSNGREQAVKPEVHRHNKHKITH